MSIEIQQSWDAVYNDRLQRANQTQDPALRAHFQAEVKVIEQTLQALKAGSNTGPTPAGPKDSALPDSLADLQDKAPSLMDDGAEPAQRDKTAGSKEADPLEGPTANSDATPPPEPVAEAAPPSTEDPLLDGTTVLNESELAAAIANDPEAQEKWVDMQTDVAMSASMVSL